MALGCYKNKRLWKLIRISSNLLLVGARFISKQRYVVNYKLTLKERVAPIKIIQLLILSQVQIRIWLTRMVLALRIPT